MKQSDILIRPFVSEKAMNQVSGTPTQDFKDGNKIQFIVHRDADKAQIKAVFEDRYEVKGGLAAGSQVVIAGASRLTDGAKVELKK